MNLQLRNARSTGCDWPSDEHSRFVLRAGIRWHVQVRGSGPVLLLLHGTGASCHSFQALMPLLTPRFTVVAPDLPGHALSECSASFVPSLPAIADALHELLRELQCAPVVAVGHSAGAAVALRLALDGAIEPQLLVGIAPALLPMPRLTRALLSRAARALAGASSVLAWSVDDSQRVAWILRSTGAALDARGVESYRRLSTRPSHVAGTLSMLAAWDLAPLYAQLPRLRLPLLLLAGERDRAVTPTQVWTVAARTPAARVRVVPGAGHLLHEEQPQTVARLIREQAEAIAVQRANGRRNQE